MQTIYITTFFIFFIAIIIGGIYMLIYDRKINKALRENNGKHISMPDVRSVIIFILVVVLFYGVYSTKNKTEFIYDEMIGEFRSLEYDMNALRNNMSAISQELYELKNANKNVQSFSYDVASCDAENVKVTYNLEIILKQYSQSTKVSLNINDKVVELNGDLSGKYTGQFTVSMFEAIYGPITVSIDNDGMVTNEEVDNIFPNNGWKEYIPTLYAMPVFGYEYDYDKNTITLDNNLELGVINVGESHFTDLYLEIAVKGEEVKKVEVGYDPNKNDYSIDLDNYLPKLYPASQMIIHLVGEDSLGYTHKLLVHVWMDERWVSFEDIEDIYDKDGNPLTYNEPILEVY